ncbi:MAG: hypothetical protein L0H15_03480 [Nitrosospira sp.]|nr:hypothetical protein [Nitrosospira sp.]
MDTDGILYTVAWLDMESAQGVYDFSTIITALDYAASKGKNVIVRIFYKTYVAAHPKPLPAYILSDHATYGGSPTSGGLLPNQFSAWTPRMHNAAVMARFKALVSAMADVIGSHPALQGISVDESAWSLTSASGTWPVAGLTAQDTTNTHREISAHLKACFPDKEVYVFCNYFEGNNAATCLENLRWYVAQGYLPAITDTFRRPENNASIQPTDPAYPMAAKTLMDVEWMSTGADDSGLTERMIQNAMEHARCGAHISAWMARGGATSNYWVAMKNAMAVVG